ncbi:hypothetical protein [Tenuifilum osseticum]
MKGVGVVTAGGVASGGVRSNAFVPRRKRPNWRNRSEVPVSTHIGYTHC